MLSNSKLGIYVMHGTSGAQPSVGAQKVIAGGPKMIVAFDPHRLPAVMQLVREYKTAYPEGMVAMRVFEGTQESYYTLADDPRTAALDFWQTALLPAVNGLAPGDLRLIDYLIGPNEYSCHPPLAPASAGWIGQFWARLATFVGSAGLRPIMGEIPVGNPDIGAIAQIMPGLVPALQTIRSLGGAWSYHAYTLEYSTDPAVEIWYSLRYRQLYSYLRHYYPALGDMPLVLTETGVDKTGSPMTSGWNARGDTGSYQSWLQWFDTQMQFDSYVLGSAIFQIGDVYWSSFNIEALAEWLGIYLKHAGFSRVFLPSLRNGS